MAMIIQNDFDLQDPKTYRHLTQLSAEPVFLIENLLNNSPFLKYEKTIKEDKARNRVEANILFESLHSLKAVARVQFDLKLNAIFLEMAILRHSQILKMTSKGKVNMMCRLIQRYNAHLAQHNMAFHIDSNNGRIAIRNPTISYQHTILYEEVNKLYEMTIKIFQLVEEQVIYLIQCANQRFEWEIYSRDARYMDKVNMDMVETMKIRELIALSSICFQHNANDVQGKYQKNKELINFLNHRENMVNPTQKKQCFMGQEMNLFGLFLEPLFFTTNPLPLDKLQSDFTKQFDPFFYKFQARKMVNGDNPYLFNTILVKNEDRVDLSESFCEGGFSNLKIAEMEIAYTESQNLVLDMPNLCGNSPQKKSWADDFDYGNKKKISYFPKVIAVKMNKTEADYEKIKHQKIIVQNFRTTASPFVLKYYNCTQKRFKYRQYLLMDYLGPTLTLSQYSTLHGSVFSMHSKMHIFIHLANALTFLEKQLVVHMDLSSHNVMVCKDLLIKVIDFGEAYHPYLDSDKTVKYLPGHTLPYCPPENFNRLKKFTSRSDVFSVGIMLYRLLFNDFPFAPTGELKERYLQRTYLQRWMMAPERVGEYGYEPQLLLLLQLVSRCLSPEESRRPHPYWLYVILNKIFLSLK